MSATTSLETNTRWLSSPSRSELQKPTVTQNATAVKQATARVTKRVLILTFLTDCMGFS